MNDAQKLILETLRKSLPPFDGFDHACAVAADEVDKALGGLTLAWGARMIGDDEVTAGSEGTARYCARREPKTWNAMSHWVSGWAVVE